MIVAPLCMSCGQKHYRDVRCPEVIRRGGVSVLKNQPPDIPEVTPTDDWSDCPHCKARRDKHNERTKRYRAKLRAGNE